MGSNGSKRTPRVYLDVCAIQRPGDDQTDPRVRAETEAVEEIIALGGAGSLVLLGSTAHVMEASRTTMPERRRRMREYLEQTAGVAVDPAAARLARWLLDFRLDPMDALHLATAVSGEADYLCTCDDRFLKRARAVPSIAIRVVSPLELVEEVLR